MTLLARSEKEVFKTWNDFYPIHYGWRSIDQLSSLMATNSFNASSKHWKLKYWSTCCQLWYFKSIKLFYVCAWVCWDVLGIIEIMFGICSTTRNAFGYVRVMLGYARVTLMRSVLFGLHSWKVFFFFNSSILTQSWWYSVRHNSCFPEFLSVSNSVSFYDVAISWAICISFLSLINLTLVFIRQHDICLVEFVFNTCKILTSVDVGLSTVHGWHV